MNKKFIDQSEESVSKYLKDIRRYNVINRDDEAILAKRIQDGDSSAIVELVNANLRFVISIAKDYQNSGIPLSDIISEGNYGLIVAAHKFDVSKGYKFISYAVWWIRQAILQSLNEDSRMIRLPANVINKVSKSKKDIELFSKDNDRDPINDELCLGIYPTCTSFNETVNEEGDELVNFMYDKDQKWHDEITISDNHVKDSINNVLGVLSDREREIVESYYGINGDPMTLEMIGDEYGLTKERIRQIKDKAIRKLRHNIDVLNILNK